MFLLLWGYFLMSIVLLIKINEQVCLNLIVFFGLIVLILVLIVVFIFYFDSVGVLFGCIQVWLLYSFGWYYMLVIGVYLFFVVWVVFLCFGIFKFGEEYEKLDFSYGVWVGMLFFFGIGILLFYFVVFELIDYFYYLFEGVFGSFQVVCQVL